MEQSPIEMNPKTEQMAPNYKRLYAEFNREVIAKMKARNLDVEEEPYDLNEVIRYLGDAPSRMERQLDDRNAMKAQIFSEWLLQKGVVLPESN